MKQKNDIFLQLKTRLKEYGAECRMVSASHIPGLESEYDLSVKSPYISRQFVEDNIQNYIDFSFAVKNPSILSLIIIATPSPEVEIKFNDKGKIYTFRIPPHYSDKIKINRNVTNICSQLFGPNGYRTFPVILPKKLLAVRSGLASFGKNNLAYIPGMGSYHRLTVFASDLPCVHDSWQDSKMLERCVKCKACLKNCPAGAISAGRFLINAEICLTYFNEQLKPIPDWIDPGSHNSIVGCMRCQSVCPENIKYKFTPVSGESFSKRETNLILKGTPLEELPEKLQLKIDNMGIQRYYRHLPRNINMLIDNKATRKRQDASI
jgi:epoxyqueuosine reductase